MSSPYNELKLVFLLLAVIARIESESALRLLDRTLMRKGTDRILPTLSVLHAFNTQTIKTLLICCLSDKSSVYFSVVSNFSYVSREFRSGFSLYPLILTVLVTHSVGEREVGGWINKFAVNSVTLCDGFVRYAECECVNMMRSGKKSPEGGRQKIYLIPDGSRQINPWEIEDDFSVNDLRGTLSCQGMFSVLLVK